MARNVVIDIKAKTSQYERAMKSSTKATKGLGESLAGFAKKGAMIGAAGVAVGVAAIGTAALKVGIQSATAFASFERSLSQMEGLVGVAHDQVVEFGEGIKDLAVEAGRGPQELAEAMFFITSAGLEGAEAMDALEVSAKAAAAGLGQTETIADVVTSAMNAYGEEMGGAAVATDVLVASVREGKASAPELAGSLGQVIPIASAMGVEFHEVGAAIAAMTRTGLNANEAGTALRSILNSLLAPTSDAKMALDEMGLSAQGLRDQISEDGLFNTLKTLNTAFDGQAEATTRVFGNVRALTGVMSLLGKNSEATQEIFDSLADSSGALEHAFGVTAETGAFAFEQAKARIESALLDVGAEILPKIADAIDDIAPHLPDLIGAIGDLSIAMVNFGVQAVPYMVDGFAEAELALIKFETGLLRTERMLDTGVLGGIGEVQNALFEVVSLGNYDVGPDWNSDKADRLAWLEIQQVTLKGIKAEHNEWGIMREAVERMAEGNIINAESLGFVQEMMGLTDAELVTLVNDSILYENRLGLTADQLAAVTMAYGDQNKATQEATINMWGAAEAAERAALEANYLDGGVGDVSDTIESEMIPALSEFQLGLQAAEDAQESLADAVKAFADPAFKAVKAVQKLKAAEEKLVEVQKDEKSTAEDVAAAQLEIVEAMFEAQGALDGVSGAALEAALAAITQALGVSDEEARTLLETLGILDGTTVTSVVEVKGVVSGDSRALAQLDAGFSAVSVGGLAAGGPVEAGGAYVVGEEGPELFVPNTAGSIIPNGSFAGGGSAPSSGGVTVIVKDSNHRDLQGDIGEGLMRAGVAEQFDLIGGY